MREQLVQYVDLLFAGTVDCDEMKQEILQNTLDRFDDLVAQGKSPEAAYRLSITGIGDVSEILGCVTKSENTSSQIPASENTESVRDDEEKKKLRAIGISLYILCAIPLFILSDLGLETIGLSLTICLVAIATYIMIVTGKKSNEQDTEKASIATDTPQQNLKDSINKLIGAITLAIYLIVSFATNAWYITWLIFPIFGCVKGLMNAIIDLKEACKYEN